MGDPIIDVQDLKKYYKLSSRVWFKNNTQIVQALNGISLQVNRGEVFGIVGESGCGKSTFGRCLIKIIDATSGKISLDGHDLLSMDKTELRRTVQMVFQNPYASLNPRLTISHTLREILRYYKIARGNETDKLKDILNDVNLSTEVLSKYPGELSGGQLQRIAIARALLLEPKIIIADEPVSALDVSVQAQILNLFLKLRDELNLTIIFISHNLSVVEYVSDRVAVMYLGEIMELANVNELYNNSLHPYTKLLIESIPLPDPTRRRSHSNSEGELPSPINLPKGCLFYNRCKFRKDVCKMNRPQLLKIGQDHFVACHLYDGANLGGDQTIDHQMDTSRVK